MTSLKAPAFHVSVVPLLPWHPGQFFSPEAHSALARYGLIGFIEEYGCVVTRPKEKAS